MSNIIQIKDFDAPELDIYARLNEGQLLNRADPQNGLFIAESPLVIGRAIDAGYIPVSFLVEDKHIETHAKPFIKRFDNIPFYTAAFDVLTKLTGFKLTRGMLCAMKRPALESVTTVCKNASRIAVLENVMNPTNVGAIFRSAAALNVDAILLTSSCSDPLYRRAIRVSMGTVFQIPWTYMINPSDNSDLNINYLNDLGFKTAAMALCQDSLSIDNPVLCSEKKLAIVLGSEGYGLNADTIKSCDYTVQIPMSHNVDSLNVAAASAVAFWQLCRH